MFKTVVITSLMDSEEVTRDMKARSNLEQSNEWTLFEVVNDIGIGT